MSFSLWVTIRPYTPRFLTGTNRKSRHSVWAPLHWFPVNFRFNFRDLALNPLPLSLCCADSTDSFKKQLKTSLNSQSLNEFVVLWFNVIVLQCSFWFNWEALCSFYLWKVLFVSQTHRFFICSTDKIQLLAIFIDNHFNYKHPFSVIFCLCNVMVSDFDKVFDFYFESTIF